MTMEPPKNGQLTGHDFLVDSSPQYLIVPEDLHGLFLNQMSASMYMQIFVEASQECLDPNFALHFFIPRTKQSGFCFRRSHIFPFRILATHIRISGYLDRCISLRSSLVCL